MSIISTFSEKFHYWLDTLISVNLSAKIENFTLDKNHQLITVNYRLGRQKLLHSLDIKTFEQQYFCAVSSYDKHRLTKFSTLQQLLSSIFRNESNTKKDFLNYIQGEINNEQLF